MGLVFDRITGRYEEPFPSRECLAAVRFGPSGCDVHIARKSLRPVPAVPRGEIRGFSEDSRRRLRRLLVSLDLDTIAASSVRAARARAYFVTLTYPEEVSGDWSQWKRDLRAFLKRVKRAFDLQGYLWKLEFQQRGAPHFHLVLVFRSLVSARILRVFVSRAWYEVVGSGDERHLRAGTNCTVLYKSPGLLPYLVKYLGKQVDADTATGRIWGCVGLDRVVFALWFVATAAWHNFCAFVRRLRRWSRSVYVRGRSVKASFVVFGDGFRLFQLTCGLLKEVQYA